MGHAADARPVVQDPLVCALRLVRADNERDLVRYHALLAEHFRGEADGRPVALGADEEAAATARSWAAHPEARVVVEDAELVGGFVLLRYRVVEPGAEHRAAAVLEILGGRVVRAWRYRDTA
jgi:hypothetical protein